ncbi:MAG: response regulator [Muribaculaceae bacterium]|nr:response regulator [Muribaculaceae bacterium]
MTQLTINIENKSIVPHLKKILSAIEGVSISKPEKKNKKSGIEESFEDARAGRVTHYASAEEMFKAFGI